MRTLWKILIALCLVLPLGSYVAGSLASSSADEPAPRETIVIRDSPTSPGTASPGRSSSADPTDDQGDDPGDDPGDDDVRVVTPDPDDLDDDSDDAGRDGDDHGDDSGGERGDDHDGEGDDDD